MAWTWVQGQTAHTVTSTLSLVMPGPTPAGNIVIASFTSYQTAIGAVSVKDSLGPVFTAGPQVRNIAAGPIDTEIWWYVMPATRTLTINFTGFNFIGATADEFAPPAGTILNIGQASNSGSSAAPATGSFAVGAGRLCYSVCGNVNPDPVVTVGAGFTAGQAIAAVSGQNMGVAAEYKLSPSANENPNYTEGSSSNWTAAAIALGLAGGTSGPVSVMLTDGCVPQPLRRHRLKRHIRI